MAIRNVVQVTKGVQYTGSNSAEIIEVANSTGYGPFAVVQEGSSQLTIGIGGQGWFTLTVGKAMVGTSVLTQQEWETQIAALTVIGEE